MIELPLPARVERRVIQTARRPVPVLCGDPDPDADTGIDVVMVSGFFGTKEDFRELISLLAEAGLRGWSYDYSGQLDPEHEDDEFTIARMAGELRDVMQAATGGGRRTSSGTASAGSWPGRPSWPTRPACGA